MGSCVISDDFEHDVTLRISGDFADDAQRLAYAEWLCAVLNNVSHSIRAQQPHSQGAEPK
jgi:hypothetical protein